MDTTVALIFSLGIALGGQDTSAAGIETTPSPLNKAKLSQRQHKVQQRIKLTNAWLKQQKLARRALATKQFQTNKHRQVNAQLASTLSCTADWDTV
jgi:hypothetical protein